MFDLTGDVAIVTGGNGGLGLAYARGLVKCGAQVAVWGRNSEKNNAAIEELCALGGDVEAFACDVTSEEQVASAFNATIARFGKVNACFANAGGSGFRGASHKVGRQAWLDSIDLNLMSVVQTWAPVTEHMLARGEGGRAYCNLVYCSAYWLSWCCELFNHQGGREWAGASACYGTRRSRYPSQRYFAGFHRNRNVT